jgi:hypothetical protein
MTTFIDARGSGTICEHCDGPVVRHLERLQRESDRIVGAFVFVLGAGMLTGCFYFGSFRETTTIVSIVLGALSVAGGVVAWVRGLD